MFTSTSKDNTTLTPKQALAKPEAGDWAFACFQNTKIRQVNSLHSKKLQWNVLFYKLGHSKQTSSALIALTSTSMQQHRDAGDVTGTHDAPRPLTYTNWRARRTKPRRRRKQKIRRLRAPSLLPSSFFPPLGVFLVWGSWAPAHSVTFGGRPPEAASGRPPEMTRGRQQPGGQHLPPDCRLCCIAPPADSPSAALGRIRPRNSMWQHLLSTRWFVEHESNLESLLKGSLVEPREPRESLVEPFELPLSLSRHGLYIHIEGQGKDWQL